MFQVPGGAGHEVIQAEDLMSFGKQPVAEVGADEARGSRHDESQMFSRHPMGLLSAKGCGAHHPTNPGIHPAELRLARIPQKYRIHCATLAVYGSAYVAGSGNIRRAVVRLALRILAPIRQSVANRAALQKRPGISRSEERRVGNACRSRL